MKRKNVLVAINAAFGPVLIALTMIAFRSAQFRSIVGREDGGLHGAWAITLAVALIYSFVFQLWLVKLLFEPRISRAFDQIGRR
jgi:hypothetical protein